MEEKIIMVASECWIDTRPESISDSLISEVYNTAIDAVVLSPEDLDSYEFPAGISIALDVSPETNSSRHFRTADIVVTSDREAAAKAREYDCRVALELRSDENGGSPSTLSEAETIDETDYLVVGTESTGAEFELPPEWEDHAEMTVVGGVETPTEAESVFAQSENRDRGVLISRFDESDLDEYVELREASTRSSIPMDVFEVETVEHLGTGTRCCIDVPLLMDTTEGMLVGSTNAGGLFVCAEAEAPPNGSPRPFRVNLGGVHSYVWTEVDNWEYLTSLNAGDSVACLRADGSITETRVGRSLVADRPLVLVVASNGDRKVTAVLQDHGHVRLMRPEQGAVSIPNLEVGDRILGHATTRPRPDIDGSTVGIERRDIE